MILFWLIAVPLLGGGLAWLAGRWHGEAPRFVALLALIIDALLVLPLLADSGVSPEDAWLRQLTWTWIPRFGIGFHLGLDGLSLLLIALTVFLGFMALFCSWTEIKESSGAFHFNLLWTVAGVVGVFLALDLFLFFFFWEVMLIPMYFLISIWGHEDRAYAAMKFFIFTQVSGLLMLIAILALVFVHRQSSGMVTFDYFDLLRTDLQPGMARWLMLGFFIAFTVKLPSVPFHTWLPDAHTQAPTGGSVLLAGILLKTGAYGLLRFVVPLFPQAAQEFSPIAMALGAVSILYAAKLAFAQSDLKRLVAYTSISHMGFVLVGVFAWNAWALQGAVMTMLAHGISAAALFMIAGALQERLHTREMGNMGGFWTLAPRLGAIALFFSVATLGMPGLGNFIGEFLVLLGAFRVNVIMTVIATLGLIVAPIYALIVIQKVFHGAPERAGLRDFGARETASMVAMMAATVWMGLYPQSMLDLSDGALRTIQGATPTLPLPPAEDWGEGELLRAKEKMSVLPFIPAGMSEIQRPRIAGHLHPCNLDPGTPCRGDDVAALSLPATNVFSLTPIPEGVQP
jgi:NADH-quinone oxidoreductase subunit M